MNKINNRQLAILSALLITPKQSTSALARVMAVPVPTLNRDLRYLLQAGLIQRAGNGKNTVYILSSVNDFPVNLVDYFSKSDADRFVQPFNMNLFTLMKSQSLFSKDECDMLMTYSHNFKVAFGERSCVLQKKEWERFTIELSWKSSEIEGNTYTLLDTEVLLTENKRANGHSDFEAQMLLNHKLALDFIFDNPDFGRIINVSKIEMLHQLLVNELGVPLNIRSKMVGIVGSEFKPIDNQHQIREALEKLCDLINTKIDPYEKALLIVLLISYIQPFEDGNKRTARILANAVLLAFMAPPISYRSVDALDYKKAVLVFYESQNLNPFKKLFLDQVEFSTKHYFL